jgi:hypothetical protein
MEALYRAELGTTCATARDDEAYGAALVAVCGYWTLSTLTWHLESALKEIGEWGVNTVHARVLNPRRCRFTRRFVDHQQGMSA